MAHQWLRWIALNGVIVANIVMAQPLAEPDWRTLVEPSRPVSVTPTIFVPTALAESDDGSRYLADRWHLVRITPNGDSQIATFAAPSEAHVLRYLPNGNLQSVDEHCRVITHTSRGQPVWQMGDTSNYLFCATPVLAGDGTAFLLTPLLGGDRTMSTLLHVGPHGQPRTLATISTPFAEKGLLLKLRPDGALVVAYLSDLDTIEIVATDGDGQRLWLSRVAQPNGRLADMAVRADDTVDLMVTARVDEEFILRRLTVGRSGDLRENQVIVSLPPKRFFEDVRIDRFGHVDTVDKVDFVHRLRRFGPDGNLQWEISRSAENTRFTHKGLHPLVDGDVLWLYNVDNSLGDAVSHIERFTPGGTLRYALRYPGDGSYLGESNNDGLHVLSQRTDISTLLAITGAGEVGSAVSLPRIPSAGHVPSVPYAHVKAEIDGDGHTYLLEQTPLYETETTDAQLVKLGPAGEIAWRRPLTDIPRYGWDSMISCGPHHLCLGAGGQIWKFAKADGALLWISAAGSDGELYAYDDGAVLSVSRPLGPPFPRLTRVSLVDRNGVAILLPEHRSITLIDFHPLHGALFFNFGESSTSLELLGSTGESRDFLRPVPESIGQRPDALDRHVAALLDDRRRLTLLHDVVIGTGDDVRLERRLSRVEDGGVQWSVVVPDNDQVIVPARMLVLAEGDVVVSFHPVVHGAPAHVLARYDSDGNVVWYRNVIMNDQIFTDLVAGPDNRLLLRGHRFESRESILAIHDADSGDVVRQRVFDCQHMSCYEEVIDITSDGRVLSAATGHSTTGWPVQSFSGLFDDPRFVPLGQEALSGFWYAPATTGQGFSMQFFPELSGIFMPWFTFDAGEGNSPQRLRWYVLEGGINAGDGEALLPIAEVTGGRFDQPGQQKTIVGAARLRFESCEHGLLDYRFDDQHNEGAQGTAVLQRMLPSTYDCLEGDGGILPAQADIDPLLSGVWYDPTEPGQGLHVFKTSGVNGIFFGAWYTFDPNPATGMANDQHWFTLQQLSAIENGFTAGIFQTLGGSFDRVATRNVYRIGTVELRPISCDRLELSYLFDGDSELELFTDHAGTIQLYRLGDCPAD